MRENEEMIYVHGVDGMGKSCKCGKVNMMVDFPNPDDCQVFQKDLYEFIGKYTKEYTNY